MKAILVGAGVGGKIDKRQVENALVIAVDGGYETLKKADVRPDIALGDFDSYSGEIDAKEVITLPVAKDDTDMFYAIKLALSRGCDGIFIYGGTGGRLDHTLANLQSMRYIVRHGATAVMFFENQTSVATDRGVVFLPQARGDIGAVSLTPESVITNSGLLYKAENLRITDDFPIAVSNTFTGDGGYIRVDSGMILVITSTKNYPFLKFL